MNSGETDKSVLSSHSSSLSLLLDDNPIFAVIHASSSVQSLLL